MLLNIDTRNYGALSIENWEYSLMLVYVLIFYAIFARHKSVRIKLNPEYRYFLFGFWAKMFGALFFSLIYFYYYKGGDTTNYFFSSLALSNLAKIDFLTYLKVLFGPNTEEMRYHFTPETGYPYYFVYYETRAYMVVRITSVISLFAFKSHLVTTVIIATISYIGVFRFYRTIVRYFPSLQHQLALAVLFMPSCIFWGSGILTDTFTFSQDSIESS